MSRGSRLPVVAAAVAGLTIAGGPRVPAQPGARPVRIAVICGVRCEGPSYEAFRQALRDHGRIEGQNTVLDIRGAGGHFDRLPALLTEVLAARPDIIVAIGPQPVRAARDATSTVPIVMIGVADPVLIGLVPSLTRPGANLTGLTTLPSGGFIAKQLELLKEMVPGATRIAVFWNSRNEIHRANMSRELPPAAERLGVRLQLLDVRGPDEIEPAFEAASRGRAEALLAVGDPLFHRPPARLPDQALRLRLPSIYIDRDVAAAGGLMAYGPDFVEMFVRVADYVDRILKGARPADMPIEQPRKFVLAINQRTAAALGITVPPALLLRADEVIQ